jgi:antitoxin HicB
MRNFDYPVRLTKEKKGGYLVRFCDFPEAITQGESLEDALNEAADCLEEAVANRIEMRLEIPVPSALKRGQHLVSVPATLAAKAALYIAISENKLSNIALAKKLECDEKEIRRMLDPHYISKMPRIEYALHMLGNRLHVGVSSY